MLYKTRGIVFRYTKYGDTSIIVNVFTHLFGLQSYIVNSVRSKKSRNPISLFQPLTLLDLVVYHRETANILRIKEVKCLYPYQTIHLDIRKTTIALFLNELMNKAVRDQSNTETTFEFLMDSLVAFDQLDRVENFHLLFLIKLSRYLGFGPQSTGDVLDGYRIDEAEDRVLHSLLDAGYNQALNISSLQRKNILEALLVFYQRHIETLGPIKSVEVLTEVLN